MRGMRCSWSTLPMSVRHADARWLAGAVLALRVSDINCHLMAGLSVTEASVTQQLAYLLPPPTTPTIWPRRAVRRLQTSIRRGLKICGSLVGLYALPRQRRQIEVDRISASVSISTRMRTNGHFPRTFGFGRKQSYYIRCTFGFGVLQLVNSVVAESRVQSLSCRGRKCARRRESLALLTM